MPSKKFKGFEAEGGKMTDVAYFHGYNFGDRLLEGLWFKATVKTDGRLSVAVADEHQKDFFTTALNKKHWMKEALIYAEGNDLFASEPGGDLTLALIP